MKFFKQAHINSQICPTLLHIMLVASGVIEVINYLFQIQC